jgi:hypothetical protein
MTRYEVKWYLEKMGIHPTINRSLVKAETPEQAVQEILKRQFKGPYQTNSTVVILHVTPISHPSKIIYTSPIGARILT